MSLPEFMRENHSSSREVGAVRELHFQTPPHARRKLVRCGRGHLSNVAVDVRTGSPTCDQWYGEELSFDNGLQLLIPAVLLHGFMTLEPDTQIVHKVTDYYAPDCDGAVRWDSAGIDWPLAGLKPEIPPKDADAITFVNFETPFTLEDE